MAVARLEKFPVLEGLGLLSLFLLLVSSRFVTGSSASWAESDLQQLLVIRRYVAF